MKKNSKRQTLTWVIVFLVTVALSLGGLAIFSNKTAYAGITDWIDGIRGYETSRIIVDFNNPQRFSYDVSKVHVDKDGAKLTAVGENADIITMDPLRLMKGDKLVGFHEDALKWPGSNIKYQLSGDYVNWYYYDGKDWQPVGNCIDCSNTAVEVHQNIDKLPIFSDGLKIRSIFESVNKPAVIYSLEVDVRGQKMELSPVEKQQLAYFRVAHAGKDDFVEGEGGEIDIAALLDDDDDDDNGDDDNGDDDNGDDDNGDDDNGDDDNGDDDNGDDDGDDDNGDEDDDDEEPGDGECGECAGKVTWLTLKYNGDESADVTVVQVKDDDVVYDGNVLPGMEFTFYGTWKKDTLGTEIIINIDDFEHTRIHTSCSEPIGIGTIAGDFEIVNGESRNGGPLCPIIVEEEFLPVRPILECVVNNQDGTYTAHFGYLNENDESIEIPVGGDNKFTPSPQDRGQTTIFEPGRTEFYPDSEFTVDFDGTNLVWTLEGPDGARRTSTASSNPVQACPVTVEPDVIFDDEDTAFCEYEEIELTIGGRVVLSEGEIATLQLSYRIVEPQDKATETTYVSGDEVQNGDRFEINVPWPGIEADDEAVEVHIGGMLLNAETGNPIMSEGSNLEYYWDPTVCPAPEPGCYAAHVIDFNQGLQNGGQPVLAARSDTLSVLGEPDSNNNTEPPNTFYSLGFLEEDTYITVHFDATVHDEAGDDITVFEITKLPYPMERAEIFASYNGIDFYSLGEVDRTGSVDLADGGLAEANYIKIVDRTDRSLYASFPDADAYDIDAIEASVCTANFCGNGVIDAGEECDDGNLRDGDGCSSACLEEAVCDPNLELITNGGFEAITSTNSRKWDIFPNGTPALGWVVEWNTNQTEHGGMTRPEDANLEIQFGVNNWMSAEGNQHAELDTDWDGPGGGVNGEPASVRIYQDIATIPGETYTVRFSYSPRPNTSADNNILEISWDGSVQATIQSIGGTDVEWQDYAFNFTASDSITRLQFADIGTSDSLGTFLDDVSVRCGATGAVCGNGVIEPGEECDDGNNDNYDGCSSTCSIELGECLPRAFLRIDYTRVENQGSGNSTPATFVGPVPDEFATGEIIDLTGVSGNFINDSGLIESVPGLSLQRTSNELYLFLEGRQQSDDLEIVDAIVRLKNAVFTGFQNDPNNTLEKQGDGIYLDKAGQDEIFPNIGTSRVDVFTRVNTKTDAWWLEYECVPTAIECGNGFLEGDEECDDGNNLPGDGCSPLCELEVWDYSDLSVSGQCVAPNAVFTITNNGEELIGDMSGPSFYRVYRNNVLDTSGAFQLAGGASLEVIIAANGDVIEIEVDQRPGYPGAPMVTAEVTNCYELQEPVALDDYVITLLNSNVSIDVLANDFDPDGILLPSSTSVIAGPAHGTTSVDPLTGFITYTPSVGYYGPDEFDYEVCDDSGFCAEATVYVTVQARPEALDDGGTTTVNTPIEIDILANDSDLDGTLDVSSINIDPTPSNGIVTIDPITGAVTYTPEYNWYGTDYFTYEVCDNDGLCDTAQVAIAVKAPPVALDDAKATAINTPVDIDILTNDYDPDGFLVASSVTIDSGPSNGSVTYDDVTGIATYAPNSGFVGTDEFDYTVCDDEGYCDSATVTIGVDTGVGPVANDDAVETRYETPIDIDVVDNDEDADGTLDLNSLRVISGPSNGTTSVSLTGIINYVPDAGFSGLDYFIYEICDNDGFCDTATVNITVNAPPEINDDTATTTEGTAVDIDVLANDTDADGSIDPTSVVITDPPEHGTIAVDPVTGVVTYTPDGGYLGDDVFSYQACDNDGDCGEADVEISVTEPQYAPVAYDDSVDSCADIDVEIPVLLNDYDPNGNIDPTSVHVVSGPSNGTATVNPTNGNITYSPDAGYLGADILRYEVCDETGLCGQADVYINVGECAIPQFYPTAVDDIAETNEGVSVDVDVAANDTDPDNNLDPTTVAITDPPPNGTVTVDPVTGVVTYTPDPDFYGTDSFTYSICDTTARCDTGEVTVEVNGAPDVGDDNATTSVDTPVDIDVLANDSDPDGVVDPTSVTITQDPTNGSVSIDPVTGVVTYTPDPGYEGVDSFIYQVCDNESACSEGEVTVGVGGDLEPVAVNDTVQTNYQTPINISILANDYDFDGVLDSNSVTIINNPSNGTVIYNPTTEQATYTPNQNYYGTDTFRYEVCDNDGFCDQANVTVTVLSPSGAVLGAGYVPPGGGGGGTSPTGGDEGDGGEPGGEVAPVAPPTGPLAEPPIEPPTESVAPPEGPDLPPPPVVPLVIPDVVLPVPDLGETVTTIGIDETFCGDRVYTADNITFVGSADVPPSEISKLQYSLSDGLGWYEVDQYTASGNGTVFNFTLSQVPANSYSAIIRLIDNEGNVFSSELCEFSVEGEVIFGGNQFVVRSHQAPLSQYGIVQFAVGVPQTFYLETVGATWAKIINLDTEDEFPMVYDESLKLWVGDVVFDKAGTFRLAGAVGNNIDDVYQREINTAVVTEPVGVVDAETGENIDFAVATVYVKDPATGEFNEWQGAAFGHANPFAIPDGLVVVLPKGEYYIRIAAGGYDPVNSLITVIDQTSVITAKVQIPKTGRLAERVTSTVSEDDRSHNYRLNVIPLPEEALLGIGEIVPGVTAYNSAGEIVNILPNIRYDKPTVLFVYNFWNTSAQEQLDIYRNISLELADEYSFVPLTTLEPANVNWRQLNRGRYDIKFLKPTLDFYDNYKIISLPQFFLINEQRELLGTIVGPRSQEELLGLLEGYLIE